MLFWKNDVGSSIFVLKIIFEKKVKKTTTFRETAVGRKIAAKSAATVKKEKIYVRLRFRDFVAMKKSISVGLKLM